MMDKRARKIEAVIDSLPKGHRFGNPSAPIGILGIGMESGVMAEAVERLTATGTPIAGLQPRTIWPVPDETLEFLTSKERVYVVEHNHEGQLAQILASVGRHCATVTSILKYNGEPFTPSELVQRITDKETT